MIPIYAIFEEVAKASGDEAKLKILLDNDSLPLRTIIRAIYDKNLKCLLPTTQPPYKPVMKEGNHGMIYSDSRRLHIFFEGFGYDHLDQSKREGIFIRMLESMNHKDAEILVHIATRKRLPGLLPRVAEKFLNKCERIIHAYCDVGR